MIGAPFSGERTASWLVQRVHASGTSGPLRGFARYRRRRDKRRSGATATEGPTLGTDGAPPRGSEVRADFAAKEVQHRRTRSCRLYAWVQNWAEPSRMKELSQFPNRPAAWIYVVGSLLTTIVLPIGWIAEAIRPGVALSEPVIVLVVILLPITLPYTAVWMWRNLAVPPAARGFRGLLARAPGGRLDEAARTLGWNEERWRKVRDVSTGVFIAAFVIALLGTIARSLS